MEPNAPLPQQTPPQVVTTKPNRAATAVLITLLVLLVAGTAALGYFFKKEFDAHGTTKRELSEQTKIVNDNAQIIRDAKLEPGFRKVLQDHANRDCSSNSAVLFNTTTSLEKNGDGSTKKYFAVGQFICNNGGIALAGPIRFSAAQSTDGITWEFTYGSSSGEPTSLPGYIFDTDSALYNRKYNNPKKF